MPSLASALSPTTYFVPGELTSPKFAKAFAQGCKGYASNVLTSLRPGPFAAFCTPATWPLLDQAIADGRDYYYGDHAYWRRGRYFRVTRNAVQFQPAMQDLRIARPHRLQQVSVEVVDEWRRGGSSIIICPNSPIYMRRYGLDAQQWTLDCVKAIQTVSDRPVVIRWKSQQQHRPLYLDLHDAWAVVVFSSNAAVEALVAGVPVFVLAPWASTASMGTSDLSKIESPLYPDFRLPFLWSLAEHQWSLSEIAGGYAWRVLHA